MLPLGEAHMWKPVFRNCTLVGSINPAILTFEWLVGQGLMPDVDTEATIQATRGAQVQGLMYKNSHFLWTVAPERFVAQGLAPDADPGRLVASILTELKHTPVQAVGTNLVVEAPEAPGAAAWGSRYKVELPTALAPSLLSHEVVHSFEYEESVLRLKVGAKDGAIRTIDFNFNRTVSSAADAADAALRWQADCDFAQVVLEDILGKSNADDKQE